MTNQTKRKLTGVLSQDLFSPQAESLSHKDSLELFETRSSLKAGLFSLLVPVQVSFTMVVRAIILKPQASLPSRRQRLLSISSGRIREITRPLSSKIMQMFLPLLLAIVFSDMLSGYSSILTLGIRTMPQPQSWLAKCLWTTGLHHGRKWTLKNSTRLNLFSVELLPGSSSHTILPSTGRKIIMKSSENIRSSGKGGIQMQRWTM